MAKGEFSQNLPSQQMRFLPVEPINFSPDDDHTVRNHTREYLVDSGFEPWAPLPLLTVLKAVDELKKDERFQEVAQKFDLYHDWMLPWRAAGRVTQ